MTQRFHGIDRHKHFSTVSVLDRNGHELRLIRACQLEDYHKQLDEHDAVVIEASCGSFTWADRIEATGARCYVLDPMRFRIITDSWNKTDRHDARNMAKALWVTLVTGEFGLPTVYRPGHTIRTLRRLFATYRLIVRQIRMLKSAILAMLLDDGIVLDATRRRHLFSGQHPVTEVVASDAISAGIEAALAVQVATLSSLLAAKQQLIETITKTSKPLAGQIELLMTIPGITVLTAAAFLADIGEIERFSSQRKMSAYLGLVPRCHNSGGKRRSGHINRESRNLTRTMLTQSIPHAVASCPSWQRKYHDLQARRGTGRARIAMIRHLCGVMRRMLLSHTKYSWLREELYQQKLRRYRKALEPVPNTTPAA